MQRICPVCQQRYSFNPLTDADYVHTCTTGNDALDNQDLLKVGNYTDDSGNVQRTSNPLLFGYENRLWGTRAGVEGNSIGGLTARGNRVSTHRTHRRLVWHDLRGREE